MKSSKRFHLTMVAAIALLLCATPAVIQAHDDPPEILDIRKKFLQIERELKSYETTSESFIQDAPGEGKWVAWSRNGQIQKLHTEYHSDGASESFDFYYHDNELFFVFEQFESFPVWEEQENTGKTEHRYYFLNKKLIRWIYTSHENEMKPLVQKLNNKEALNKEFFIQDISEAWLKFIESGEKDFSAFYAR